MKLRIEIECDASYELFIRRILGRFAEKPGWSFESLREAPIDHKMDYDNVHFRASIDKEVTDMGCKGKGKGKGKGGRK